MLVTIRHALGQALDTKRFDDETELFQPHVPCDEIIDYGHTIPKKDEVTRHQVCSTLLDLLVD